MIAELLEFAEGPLFRAAFVILVAGLVRRLVLLAWPIVLALRRATDRSVPLRPLWRETLGWLLPVRHLGRARPIFTLASLLFHGGLVLAPVFLAAHVALWRRGLGFGWPALPEAAVEILTALTVLGGVTLLLMRAAWRPARQVSTAADYVLPVLILLPFLTGFAATHSARPAYDWLMLAHVLSAEALFVVLPFTRLAHCVLFPVVRLAREAAVKLSLPTPQGYPAPAAQEKK